MGVAINGMDAPNLLTEEQLKHMSRHIEHLIPQRKKDEPTHNDINELETNFDRIFQVATTSNLGASYRVATWNTLCALMSQCMDSSIIEISSVVWGQNVWNRAFDLYISESCNARPKSSKQLLQTLGAALRQAGGQASSQEAIGSRLLGGICSSQNHDETKACLQALTHFLGKDLLSLNDLLSSLSTVILGNTSRSVEHIFSILFDCVGRGDFGSVVGQAISAVLDKAATEKKLMSGRSGLEPCHHPLWSGALENVVRSKRATIDDLRLHVFPTIFKKNLPDYVSFLLRHGLDQFISPTPKTSLKFSGLDTTKDGVLCAALQAGKELGILHETSESEMTETSTSLLIPVRSIGRMLKQSSRNGRLTGLSLLITSHTATRPFLRRTFKLFRRHLSLFFADTDANFRSEVFSLMHKLMDRLRAITAVLARQKTSPVASADTAVDAAAMFDEHKNFLEWLLRFLMWELRPTASYQRHISALKSLSIVARSGLDEHVSTEYLSKSALAETKWPFHLTIMTADLRRLLVDLLMDPFDDVRQTAAVTLQLYARYLSTFRGLSKTIEQAEETMLATGRADQADGVAHMYALLYRECSDERAASESSRWQREAVVVRIVEALERMLKVAKWSLATATNKYPVHGILTSLRYIITQNHGSLDTKHLLDRLIACLHEIWETVKPVLCNDAPEGYLPEAGEAMPEMSSKDTLSYSWRALKESSLVLGTIISHPSVRLKDMRSLSDLCCTQLAELRHRGAFSTVAQTWITCCMRRCSLTSADGQDMLHLWYNQVLGILESRTTINTRRSAGLPSLLCGILIADETGILIVKAFSNLDAIARQPADSASAQESSLAQVHALNCIKDVLKTTRLGEQSETLVPDSLRLAAQSLRSEAWAIRNCGLMLFRAVIDRLLGTNDAYLDDSSASQRQFFAQSHPELLESIVDLLVVPNSGAYGTSATNSEGVFPALQLLQRTQIPDEKRPFVQAAVLALMGSRSWYVRDKAARAYAAMVSRDRVVVEIRQLLDTITDDQNALHGALLCVRHLIVRLAASGALPANRNVSGDDSNDLNRTGGFQDVYLTILSYSTRLYHKNICTATQAAYIDILTDSSSYAQRAPQSDGHRCKTARFSNVVSGSFSISKELKYAITADDSQRCTDGALRRALARAFVHDLYSTTESIEEKRDDAVALGLSLGQVDADACSLIFRTAQSFSEVEESFICPHQFGNKTLLCTASEILCDDYDIGLKCEVQRFLLNLPDQRSLSEDGVLESHALANACRRATTPTSTHSNQVYADQWLQLQAVAIEPLLHAGKHDEVVQEMIDFVHSCISAIRGDGLQSREAAALAISRLESFWAHLNQLRSGVSCDLCLAVYDLLNDDDEDIRSLAAQTSSRIFEASGLRTSLVGLEPIGASQELVILMIERWPIDGYFAAQAFSRAFNIAHSPPRSVTEQLAIFAVADTTLFAEEKQNLYVDEAREVKLWSQVILSLQTRSIPEALVKQLAYWVLDGLEALSRKFRSVPDGALGWTTKADAFTLGLQVIYGAEVLLHLVERGVTLPVPPSTLRSKLVELSAAAISGDFNQLWNRELERVLSRAVTQKLRHCSELLNMIERGQAA